MMLASFVIVSAVLSAAHAALTPYSQDLFTHRDNTIGIEVNIGTPAQTLLMSVGLRDAETIVASACCVNCCCDKEFDPYDSSTYKLKEYFSSEGNNFYDYEIGSDTVASKVSSGNSPQVNLQVISRLWGTEWEGHTFDGILPFAYTNHSQSFIDGIFQNQLPLFTIFYQRQCPAPTVSQVKAGTVTYGALDTTNCNDFSYEPFDADFSDPKSPIRLPPALLHIKSIAVGTSSVTLDQSFVQFVTEPTLLMPKAVFHELNRVWKAAIINEKTFIVDCNAKYDPLTVNFNGTQNYIIPFEHLLRNTDGVCSLDITLTDKGDKDFNNAHPNGTFGFRFGLPFLREYCLVTDYQNSRLGFGTHKNPERTDCRYSSEEPAPCNQQPFDQHCFNRPPFAIPTTTTMTPAPLTPYSQDLFTHRDNTIGIEVNIGTPAQTLLMSVGLSDGEVLVASACCVYCCCDKEFAPWQSSTYKLTEYFSSKGNNFKDYEIGSDTVASKVSTGSPPQANLRLISRLWGTEWEGHTFDGVVPFAYTGNSLSFTDGIFQNQPPLFTIFYQRQCPATTVSQAKAGTVTYGAVDTANCNDFSYEPFDADFGGPNSNPPALLHIKSISVGTTSVTLDQSFVQFVTAPTLLMPKAVFHELNKVWKAAIINEQALIVNCNGKFDPLTVNFNGTQNYIIPFEHLLRNTDGVCSLDITLTDKGDKDFNNAHPNGQFGFWFGLPFLREYCLVTDYQNRRLGFATHKNPKRTVCTYASEEPAPCNQQPFDQHCDNRPPFPVFNTTTTTTVPTTTATTTVTTSTPPTTPKAAGQAGAQYAVTSMLLLFALFIR